MKDKLLKNRKGMSLVEVVAAVAIMGITFVALLSLFTMSIGNSADTGDRTDMMMAAQDLLEQSCRIDGFNSLAVLADNQRRDIAVSDEYAERFDAARTIQYVLGTGNRMLKIIIEVKEKDSVDYKTGVSLVTQLADVE